jgi:hypothetical protein
MRIKTMLVATAVASVAVLALGAGAASASDNYAPFGAAAEIDQPSHNNVYDLVSNTGNVSAADDYSGLSRSLTAKTVSSITNLSTDYYVKAGDCGGGSPRFQLEVDMNSDGNVDGNIHVYIGDAPSYNCPQSFERWISTGNLMTSPDARFDSSGLPGGAYGQTAAQTQATFGTKKVLFIDLVVDGGWAVAGNNQDVLVEKPLYNATTIGGPFGGAAKANVATRHHVWDLLSNTGNASAADDFSGLAYTQTSQLLFNSVTQLSTDYYVQSGDCGGGSPRVSIRLDTDNNGTGDKSVFVYIGDAPNFNCPPAFQRWQSTGNLAASADLRVDTSQLPGGTFYDTMTHAKTLAGTKPVTSVSIVVDAGWAFGGLQDVWVDDFSVNNNILT